MNFDLTFTLLPFLTKSITLVTLLLASFEIWTYQASFPERNVVILNVGNSALYLLNDLANGVCEEIHYENTGYNKVGMLITTILPKYNKNKSINI